MTIQQIIFAIGEYRHWFDTCTRTQAAGWEARANAASEGMEAAIRALMKTPEPGKFTLTPTQCRALVSLLGQYQEFLESAITCELPVLDVETQRRVNRDRRRWRACEDFVKALETDTACNVGTRPLHPLAACPKCGRPMRAKDYGGMIELKCSDCSFSATELER